MIQIHLTKPEARHVRVAIKSFAPKYDQTMPIQPGENKLPRAVWHDIQRWLTWVFTDLEAKRTLEDRLASERLSMRIEATIERYDRLNPPVVVAETVAEVPSGCLF